MPNGGEPYGIYGGRSYGTYDAPHGERVLSPSSYPQNWDSRPGSSEHSILRSGGSNGKANGKPQSRVNVWELVLVPWLFLVLILICYLLGGAHGKFTVLSIIPIVLLGIFAIFIRYHYKAGNNAEVVLGFLCITAVLIGVTMGVSSVVKSLGEFYRLTQGASYFNVLPSEPAGGKLDATTLEFTSNTMVDTQRTYGYVDATKSSAPIYCIAPIFNGDDSVTHIQYWAAGINCCASRSSFTCGEASKALAHGALVYPSETQNDEMFHLAVSGAEAAYGFTSGDHYLLVSWKEEPVRYTIGLWEGTVTLFVIFAGVYLLISAMIGGALMSSLMPPREDIRQG